MKKLIVFAPLFIFAGCSLAPKQENIVMEAPKVSEARVIKPAPVVKIEPTPPQAQMPPSQYAGLNEAIKDQNDEKIYQNATQILAQTANDKAALNALAMYHYKRGRYDLCRYLLSKAIVAHPRAAELYSNLGVVQLAQGEKRNAVGSLRKALEINSTDAVAASNLGAIYTQEKDFVKSQIALEIAYSKGVRDARVLNNYAITLTSQGKFDKAEEIYKGLIKGNSSNKEYLLNYAILLVDGLGKYQEGLDVINRLKFVGGPAESRNKIITLENKAKAGLK